LNCLFGKTTREDNLECWVFFGLEAAQDDFRGKRVTKNDDMSPWLPSNDSTVEELLRMARAGDLPVLTVLILNEFPLHMRALRTNKDIVVVTVPSEARDYRAASFQKRALAASMARTRMFTLGAASDDAMKSLLQACGMDAAAAGDTTATRKLTQFRFACWQIPVRVDSECDDKRSWFGVRCSGEKIRGGAAASWECPLGCGFRGGADHKFLCAQIKRASPIDAVLWDPRLQALVVSVKETRDTQSLAHCVVSLYESVFRTRADALEALVTWGREAVEDDVQLLQAADKDVAMALLAQRLRAKCLAGVLDAADVGVVLQRVLGGGPTSAPTVWFFPLTCGPKNTCALPAARARLPGLLPPSPDASVMRDLERCLHVLSRTLSTLPDAVYWLLRRGDPDPVLTVFSCRESYRAADIVLVEHVLSLFPGSAAAGFWAQLLCLGGDLDKVLHVLDWRSACSGLDEYLAVWMARCRLLTVSGPPYALGPGKLFGTRLGTPAQRKAARDANKGHLARLPFLGPSSAAAMPGSAVAKLETACAWQKKCSADIVECTKAGKAPVDAAWAGKWNLDFLEWPVSSPPPTEAAAKPRWPRPHADLLLDDSCAVWVHFHGISGMQRDTGMPVLLAQKLAFRRATSTVPVPAVLVDVFQAGREEENRVWVVCRSPHVFGLLADALVIPAAAKVLCSPGVPPPDVVFPPTRWTLDVASSSIMRV
jgi:hypothetical protein